MSLKFKVRYRRTAGYEPRVLSTFSSLKEYEYKDVGKLLEELIKSYKITSLASQQTITGTTTAETTQEPVTAQEPTPSETTTTTTTSTTSGSTTTTSSTSTTTTSSTSTSTSSSTGTKTQVTKDIISML